MARQGQVRTWHFAHAQETDCENAAESALHKAAKECIRRAMKLWVPAISVTETARLEDGRTASATITLEANENVFDEVVLEAAVGDIRPDVTAHQKPGQLFIEIAVNHFVDEEKRAKLLAIGVPTIEIALDLIRHEAWDWDKLGELVIQSLENKQWLVFPDLAEIRAEAKCQTAPNSYQVTASNSFHLLSTSSTLSCGV
ncbi:competence protein CoiA family protein [Chitinimonas sp. BJB300]|uniref:competence protein CoiA family protein n=1 Tax=Chitinimonas sp. BJB300 TaxID=1559339 RepID=UPI000C0E2EF0|nr:hypothetical protein CSQ89_18485 [Chitinimonas sp. BJB300]